MITMVVSGGVVQDVFSDLEKQFILVDYDDKRCGEQFVHLRSTYDTNQIYPELRQDIEENLPDA